MSSDRTNRDAREPAASPSSSDRSRAVHEPRRVDSKALLGEGGELVIEHGGREYRLRKTSTGKLILTA
jgi:hemin uptake protein HemP